LSKSHKKFSNGEVKSSTVHVPLLHSSGQVVDVQFTVVSCSVTLETLGLPVFLIKTTLAVLQTSVLVVGSNAQVVMLALPPGLPSASA